MHETFKEQVIFNRIDIADIECVDNQAIYGTSPGLTSYISTFRPANYIPDHQEVTAKPQFVNSSKLVLKAVLYGSG